MPTFFHPAPAQAPADPRAVLARAASAPEHVERYGTHADALIDLYLPAQPATDAPLAVLFHGGFWKAPYDRTHLRPMAVALRARGWAVALPEYRRVGGPPGLQGGYPATYDDALRAALALPALLARRGMQPRHTRIAGHSAGGHLALWLASQPQVQADRVVALAPVADLRMAAAQNLGDGAVQALLGGPPEQEPAHYVATDVAERLSRHPGREIVIVHGQDDVQVPFDNLRCLMDRHPWITLHALAGTEHFALIDPLLHPWPVVCAALEAAPAGA